MNDQSALPHTLLLSMSRQYEFKNLEKKKGGGGICRFYIYKSKEYTTDSHSIISQMQAKNSSESSGLRSEMQNVFYSQQT